MDKKKQLAFNLNNFLLSTSHTLDFLESQHNNTSINHSKRIAFLSLKIGQKLGLNPREMFDLCAYSLCHDIALNESRTKDSKYYILSEEKIKDFPFIECKNNILKYQNERYDGLGTFGLKNNDIPLLSKILFFSQLLDEKFDLSKKDIQNRKEINSFVSENSKLLFDDTLVSAFLDISSNIDFWIDIQNENDIVYFIFNNLHDFSNSLDFEDVLKITSVFNDIMNNKSLLIDNCKKMCEFYEFEHKDKYTLMISASLCNIGKQLIPLEILEKNENLSNNEYEELKAYPYYNKKILSNIMGFNDIAICSSRIQESLDGKGYPFNLEAKDLSLKDRLLATLNIYNSLCTKKPHRNAYNKDEAFRLLEKMSEDKKIDLAIVNDIKKVL